MADTIVTLDKALNKSRAKFLAEDKDVYMELFDTEEYLINAGIVDMFKHTQKLSVKFLLSCKLLQNLEVSFVF